MRRLTPAPDLVDRFRRSLGALAGDPPCLGVAVSGGPDSVALLLLAAASMPGRISAATVDHGLRAEAAVEAEQVASLCAQLGCPHAILPVTVEDGTAGVQAEARRARYQALSAWADRNGIAYLATAHHADDQAETILMRLKRGSGLPGLSGIRAVREDGHLSIVRPLLGWTKAELVAIVDAAGVVAVDDPSNRDPRFDRTGMRAFLAANTDFEAGRLARSAAALGEAEQALGWAAEQLFDARCSADGDALTMSVMDLPRDLRRRLLSRAMGALLARDGVTGAWSGAEDIDAFLTALESGGHATRAGIAGAGGAVWRLRLAPPRRRPR